MSIYKLIVFRMRLGQSFLDATGVLHDPPDLPSVRSMDPPWRSSVSCYSMQQRS